MTTSSTSINPIEYAKETILGMSFSIEQIFGCTKRVDLATSLNSKFGVFPSRLPTAQRAVKYFCYGNGGRLNDTDGLSSAQYVSGTNMALYSMLPFRAVPLEEDLSADERANYALRQVRTINGVVYALYYLKKIVFSQSTVQYVRTDPTSGITETYELDMTNLSPTPPERDDNGVVSDVADEVSVVLPGVLEITGEEIIEAVNVLYGGDMRYAIVSEIGFVAAATETVQAADANGQSFSYAEAVFAQLVNQYDWVGDAFTSTSDTFTRSMSFSIANNILS